MQRKPRNRLFPKAFNRLRAGGSLKSGVSHGEARVRVEALTLDSQPFTGETKKEPRLFFTPTFTKQEDGFCCFTGYELGGVLCKK